MNEETTREAEAPDSLVGLIDQLIDPAPPAPVPLTPQTWGWVALALLLLILAGWALWRWHGYRVANAYRRTALAQLSQAQTAAELAAILRRAALAAFPRAEVASLTGADWTAFLGRTGKGGFSETVGEELRRAPYRDPQAAPSTELRAAATRWLETHCAATSMVSQTEAPA